MMTMIYHAGVLAVLALSVMGYGALYNRSRLPVCFFPVTLVSGVSVVLYGFGFLAALKMGCYAILLFGILMLLLCRKGFRPIAFFSDWSILFCLFAGVWLYVITRGAFLSHWDDGSHWYRICKSIYAEGAFPTTPDIMYYNYVPGCQLWNYFVLRFINFSQQNCMFAQGLINIACVATLFAGMSGAKTRMEKGFSIATVAVAGVVLCSMSVGTYALLVDLQLGLAAMALLILLLDRGNEKGVLIPGMLLFAFLLLIKNSAIFFAIMVFIWGATANRWRGKQLVGRAVVFPGVALALRYVYSIRAEIVYAGSAGSPQSISVDRFAQMLSLKKAEDVLLFTKRFLYKLIIGDTGLAATVYICVLLLILLGICFKAEKKELAAGIVRQNMIFGVVMTALYAVMLYGMYIFSVTAEEMTAVNSFYRYYGSMVAVFAGVTIYTAMACCMRSRIGGEGMQRIYILSVLLLVTIAMRGAYSNRYFLGRDRFVYPEHYGVSFWEKMQYYVPENRQYTGRRYVVFWDTKDFGDCLSHDQYPEFNVGAWLRSEKVDVISRQSIHEGMSPEQIEAIQNCDQFIFMSNMTPESELLAPYMDVSDLTVGLKYK